MKLMVDKLINNLREIFQQLPDPRNGFNCQFPFDDIAMAAFSAFFMQCPSFLDHQRRFHAAHNRNACQSLFGMKRIPSDNHIRKQLDGIEPHLAYPAFDMALQQLIENQALDPFLRFDGRILVALDGSQFHHSSKIQCSQCSTKTRSDTGAISYSHSVLCATIVADRHNRVIPLRPEFITAQDGDTKQDCENKAAHRWVRNNLPRYRNLRPILLGDDLYAHQPLCENILEHDCDFIFTAKSSSHATLYDYLQGLQRQSKVTHPKRAKGPGRETRTYQWCACPLPIRNTDDALQVYWFSMKIQYRGKTTYQNHFVTSIEPNEDNIIALANCGRARWKIENESFNILKNNGYHVEHNFGHGRQGLSNLLLTLNLIAFNFHTCCDQLCTLWRQARDRIATRKRFFTTLTVLNDYFHYTDWQHLLTNILQHGRLRKKLRSLRAAFLESVSQPMPKDVLYELKSKIRIACAVERRFTLVGANPTQQLSLRLVAAKADHGGNEMV